MNNIFEIKSPFNYAGSKQNTLEFLFSYFPKDKEIFFDMFCGGGSVSLTALNFYDKVVMNDVLTPLINVYKALKYLPYDYIYENILKLKVEKTDKESYLRLRKIFNEDKNNPLKFFACLCHCANNLIRFNSKLEFNQAFGNRTYNPNTFKKLKIYYDIIYHNQKLKLLNFNFFDLWNQIKHCDNLDKVFFYFDPPYIQTAAGYNVYWNENNEKLFYDMIDEMIDKKLSFAISNTIRHKGILNPSYDRFKNLNIIEVPVFFNKAKTINKNCVNEAKEDSIEILILPK